MSRPTVAEFLIWGKHPLVAALSSSRTRVHEVWVTPNAETEIEAALAGKNMKVRRTSMGELTASVGDVKHQGVGGRVSLEMYGGFKEWLAGVDSTAVTFGLALDGVEDPRNLGAALRSAQFFGASFCLWTRDRASAITGVVAKASVGALFALPIIRAVNLARELESSADAGWWRIGLEATAEQSLERVDMKSRPVILVVGGEESGLRRLTRDRCDELASISGHGWESLNTSVAASVAMYEICRQKLRK